MTLQFAFAFSFPNMDVRDVGSMVVYRYLQDESNWLDILADVLHEIHEIRVESCLTRVPYNSSISFTVHIPADLPDGTSLYYPMLDTKIKSILLNPLRHELEKLGCYGCSIHIKR
jgi:hypothetical protein